MGLHDVPMEMRTRRLIRERITGVSLRRSAEMMAHRRRRRRSEHACNCLLNEAEAASSRLAANVAMDLSWQRVA